jgi:hypothetical protein
VQEHQVAMFLIDQWAVKVTGSGERVVARLGQTHGQGRRGRYIPVDGAIDGVNLEFWTPARPVDWMVGIEIIEHMEDPERLVRAMVRGARKGVILTTPNPDVVDVLGCDRTHKTAVSTSDLLAWGFSSVPMPLFGKAGDTLLAWRLI